MPGNFYDNPVEVSYRFAAASLTAAAVVGRFIGPAGKTGRVRSATALVTTDTDAAAVVDIDTAAGLTNIVTIDIANAPGQFTGASATKAVIQAADDLPADTVVEVSADGTPTAGAADITVSVGWY